jgi:hypothetical protein
VKFIVEVLLQVLKRLGIKAGISFPFDLRIAALLLALLGLPLLGLLALCVHGLVKLNIFPEVLQILLEFLNPSDGDVVFSLSLAVVLLDGICGRVELLAKSVQIKILIDEQVIDLLDLLLVFVN